MKDILIKILYKIPVPFMAQGFSAFYRRISHEKKTTKESFYRTPTILKAKNRSSDTLRYRLAEKFTEQK